MKNIVYSLFISLIFTSCSSTYFLSTLNTTDSRMDKVDNGDFLTENDSLWIAYCFNGQNAPIQITVFNKLSKPLYIDWQRSALIINNVAYNYMGNKLNYVGTTNGDFFVDNTPTLFGIEGQFLGESTGLAGLPETVSIIPPGTMISHKPLRLTNLNFEHINKKRYHNFLMIDKNDESVKVKRIDFPESDSPLRFSSYLTIYSDPSNLQYYKQNFYMESLIKSKDLSPKNMDKDMAERGDMFYIEKPANTTFAEIFFGTVLLIGVTALDVSLGVSNDY